MEYHSSIYCHCGNPSTKVHCHGAFERATGTCERCGATYIAKQVKTPMGYRYEVSVIHTTQSRLMHLAEESRLLFTRM